MKRLILITLSWIIIFIVCWSAVSEGYSPIRFGSSSNVDIPTTSSNDSPAFDIKQVAQNRVKDEKHYWKVTVDKVDCNYDLSSNEDGARIINIDLTWDAMNDVPRTKTMLRLFGDDLAQTLFQEFSDLKITQLWCRWTVPYLFDKGGFIAKYKYQMIDGIVYMTDSNGLLFNMPSDYK